jgi:Ca2+-binding RTX toxin-like protein
MGTDVLRVDTRDVMSVVDGTTVAVPGRQPIVHNGSFQAFSMGQPPNAVDDTVGADLDMPVTIAVLANDTDAEGDAFDISMITQPSNGTTMQNVDGTIIYSPTNGFLGIDTFSYTIVDAFGATDTATVSVNVQQTLTVRASDWNDSGLTVLLDNGNIRVVDSMTLVDVVPSRAAAVVDSILIDGRVNASDVLTIDFNTGNPIPAGGLSFDGRDGTGIDELSLQNGNFNLIQHDLTNSSSGSVTLDSAMTISYTGLEPVTDALSAIDRVFTFSATDDAITLSDDDTPDDDFSRLAANTIETIVFRNPSGSLTINGGDGMDTISVGELEISIGEMVISVAAIDSMFAATLELNGGGGNDRISSSLISGSIALFGGAGNDVLIGGAASELIEGNSGEDRIRAGDGNDTVSGGPGNDVIDGGRGIDLLVESAVGTTPLILTDDLTSIEQASLQGDEFDNLIVAITFSGETTLLGNGGNDTLLGGLGNDSIEGGAGDDQLEGFSGDDVLLGQAGEDTLIGGAGADFLEGGADDDIVDGQQDDDTVLGGLGDDLLRGGDGNDHLESEQGADTFQGGRGNDTIFGGEGNDLLFGEEGDDQLHGEAGNDELDGGSGNDTIFGGEGDDLLTGGAGDDQLDGEGGHDTIADRSDSDQVIGTLVHSDLRIVTTATATDSDGQVAALPVDVDFLDEWDEFFVEVWGSTPADDIAAVGSFSVDIVFDASLFEAISREFGPAFTESQQGNIDNTAGRINGLSAASNLDGLGRDDFVLLASVAFRFRSDADLPNNLSGSYILPTLNDEFITDRLAIDAADGTEADADAPIPTVTEIWPVMYDLDDSRLISFGDLAIFADQFGDSISESDAAYRSDFDRNGFVSFGDLAFFADNFGRTPDTLSRQTYASNFPAAWREDSALRAVSVPNALARPIAENSEAVANADPSTKPRVESQPSPTAPATNTVNFVRQSDVDALANVVLEQFKNAGVPNTVIDELRNIKLVVANLSGKQLGLFANDRIYIDATADGHGWDTDVTPPDHSTFAPSNDSAGDNEASSHSAYDLMTVLTHEYAHAIGLPHSDNGIMRETLKLQDRPLLKTDLLDAVFCKWGEFPVI